MKVSLMRVVLLFLWMGSSLALRGASFARRAILVSAPPAVVVFISQGASGFVQDDSSVTGLGYRDNVGMRSYSGVQRAWERSAQMSQRESVLAMRTRRTSNPDVNIGTNPPLCFPPHDDHVVTPHCSP